MSDPVPGATDTSAPITPPAVVPAVVAPAAAVVAPATQDPAWLPERLERAKRDVLKELGAENVDDVKKALTDFKARQDAEKTEAQKNGEKFAELDRVKARAALLEETAKSRVAREFTTLTDSQKAAVLAIAGDDPAQQLKAIDVLSPTWVTPPAPSTTTTTTEPAKTPAVAATTAPPRAAPADTTQANLSPKEQYARLKQTNPVAAAAYLNQHAKEIYPSP